MIKLSKRSLSAVIATVLLILITVAAVSLIAGVLIPMVNNWLGTGKGCLDLNGKIDIESGSYTCYTDTNTKIMVSRKFSTTDLKGLAFSISYGGSANSYKIYNNSAISGVTMFNGGALKLPAEGGAETYVFPVKGDYVELASILSSDETCKEIEARIPPC